MTKDEFIPNHFSESKKMVKVECFEESISENSIQDEAADEKQAPNDFPHFKKPSFCPYSRK